MIHKELRLTYGCFANGGPAILTDVQPEHPYKDNKLVKEEIIGRKVTVAFPMNNYRTQVVKVADPVDMLTPVLQKAPPGTPVYVAFDGFRGSIYTPTGKDGKTLPDAVSAKADAVHIVPAPGVESDGDIELL